MVIFGKKACARIEAHEDLVADMFDAHSKLIKALQDENKMLKEKLAELTLVVENASENGTSRKTPEQLVTEWLFGDPNTEAGR